MEKRKRWKAGPAVRFKGQGDKAARARTCTAELVLHQRIFGFSRYPSPPGCGGNRRAIKWVSHTHVHHHWPTREVQEEVTALGVALGACLKPSRSGGAAGVGGGYRTGGCGGIGRMGRGYGGRCGGHCRAGRSGGIGHSGNGCCRGLAGSDSCGVSGSGRIPRGGWRC